jgi:phosphatidylglycerol:prolipoprotein diacylglycerol transferase
MKPVLIEFPDWGIRIFGFGVLMALAIFAAVRLAVARARRAGLDPDLLVDLSYWVCGFGLLGARVFFVVQYHEVIQGIGDICKFWDGGLVFYGCIIGGLGGFLAYWTLRPFAILPTLDAIAPALALGSAIGRLGCFLNGCCFGDVCRWPWAVRFPAGSLPWADEVRAGLIAPTSETSLPMHPTQLYLAGAGLVLVVILWFYFPQRRRDGEVMALLMMTYPIARFFIEFLRNDDGDLVGGLTVSQVISVGLLASGLVFWIAIGRRPAGRACQAAGGPVG